MAWLPRLSWNCGMALVELPVKRYELVDMFHASQSEIKVTAHYQGNYFDTQKLIAAVSAGVVPDVVNLKLQRGTFAAAGQLVNLEEYIDEDYDLMTSSQVCWPMDT